jgi:hypothetical protein
VALEVRSYSIHSFHQLFVAFMPKSALQGIPTGWVNEETMRSHVWPENPNLVPPWALRDLCKRRQFPHLRIGKKLFFKIAEVQVYLNQNHVAPEECKTP